MGNQPSSSTARNDFEDISYDRSAECHGDPRSPTSDIVRTPIQTNALPKTHNITKNIDLTRECFNKYEKVLADPNIKSLLNQWDPRSPTLDFQRTPLGFVIRDADLNIVRHQMNTSECEHQEVEGHDASSDEVVFSNVVPKNLYNELNNLADCSHEKIEEISTNESIDSNIHTQISSENIMQKIEEEILTPSKHPIIGLLETNLDYIETDLDTVRRKPKYNKTVEKNNVNSIIQTDNSPSYNITKIATVLSGDDPRSPSIGIDRTPIVIESKNDLTEKTSDSDYVKLNSHLQELFKNNLKIHQKKERNKNNGYEKITESLLIYEDDFTAGNTPVSLSKTFSNNQTNEGCRTPLSCMTNVENGQSKPSTPLTGKIMDLIDMKKNNSKFGSGKSKIPVKISRSSPTELPITCAKNNQRTITSQKELFNHNTLKNCKKSDMTENTPPINRKAQWDHDNSVVL